jgi:NADH-quinone oxidoreductase subunit C
MEMLVDLTAVYFPDREPRFEVVAHLLSLSRGHRLRLKARVGDAAGEHAEIASLTDLWASANWLERECYDLFGVVFRGHPELSRIQLYPSSSVTPAPRTTLRARAAAGALPTRTWTSSDLPAGRP